MSGETVVVVVLTHNGGALAIDCLRSLQRTTWPDVRLVLVDNGSTDGTADAVAAALREVEIVRSAVNRGYAGGNNLGLERALAGSCEYVLVLNDDTLVEDDAIGLLVEAMDDGVGAAAPLITYETRRDLVWYGGATYDARRPHPGRMSHYRRPVSEVSGGGPTDRFSGAAVLLSRASIERVGGFDEGLYFLYEDVDLSLRMRSAGLRIIFVPEAIVRHKVGMTQGGEHSPLSFYYGVRNELIVADRYAPTSPLRRRLRAGLTLADFALRLRHANRRRECLKALGAGIRDYGRGHTGAWSG